MSARRPPRGWLIAVAAVALAVIGAVSAAWIATPSVAKLQQLVARRVQGAGGRVVPLSRVARDLQDAVVATEDERFYRHHGIDLIGVLRAVPYDVTRLSLAEGASTITEQLAKLLYLGGNDHSPWRKLEDVVLALKLESRYGKKQILAGYLNAAYFGYGAYGIGAAADRYFGVSPARLDLAQASLLAGLVQAPSAYDPVDHPAAARARQIEVLRSLVRDRYVTTAQADAALRAPLDVRGVRLARSTGVALEPGPSFVWWELAVGAVVLAGGAGLLLFARRLPLGVRVATAVRLVAFAALLAGATVLVRSFRTA
ncbi:MAG: biosynthetic peptidoglycan transglycosylase [Gaiellaceae bacterium]